MTLPGPRVRRFQKKSRVFLKLPSRLAIVLSLISLAVALWVSADAIAQTLNPSMSNTFEINSSTVPFWKKSSARLRQIREERSVQVSSRREDLASGEMRFTFLGVGDVSKDCDFTLAMAQQFDRLPEISNHFKEVIFDPERRQLWMVANALGYQGRMLLQTDLAFARDPLALEHRPQLEFEITWGTFRGLRGVLTFEPIDLKKCEVAVEAHYQTKEPPLPKVLMGFALEVVIQKVAEKMRAFAENSPRINPKNGLEKAKMGSSQALEARMLQEHLRLTLLRAPQIVPGVLKTK